MAAYSTSIQAYLSAHVLESGNNVQSAVDWSNNFLYTIGEPSSTIYTAKFGIFTGNELAFQPGSSYSPSAPFHEYPIGFDANGVYIAGDVTTNTFISTKASDLSQLSQLTSASFNFALPQGTYSPITNTSGQTFILFTGIGVTSSTLEIYGCISTPTLALWSPGILNYNNRIAVSCSGPFKSGLGYVASSPEEFDTPPPSTLTIFTVNVNTGSMGSTLLSSIIPTNIDATWTQLGIDGMCLDKTDNNLLLSIIGTGVTSQYLVKVNATTGAIIWKLAIPATSLGPQMAQSSINIQQFGMLNTISGGSQFTLINTNTGTIVTQFSTGLSHLTTFVGQCYNDQNQQVIGEFQLAAGSGSPALLNSTPATFIGWASVFLIPPYSPIEGGGRSVSSTVQSNMAFEQQMNQLAGLTQVASVENCGDEFPSEMRYLSAKEAAFRWRTGRQ